MADESKVLVRLRLLGAALMARDAKRAAGGLKDIDRAGRGAGRGLGTIKGGKVQAELSRVGRGTLAAKRGLSDIKSGAMSAAGALKHLGLAAGALAAAGLATGIKQSANFEQSLANVQAKLLVTGRAMSPLRRLAMDLGAKTQFSANEAAGAMDELAAQGFSVRQIMATLPGTLSLAAATGTDLANAASIQTETLHGFGLAAGQAGRVADVLAQIANRSAVNIDDMQESLKYIAPVAKASGQSLTDVGAAIGLMGNVGIKGSQAGTTLRTAMVRLSNPTDKARGALAALHLSAGDLAGPKGLLSLPNIMGKVVKGSQGVSKNQRNAALATIFGREALSGMVALVEAGPKKFDRMSAALENSRGAAKRAASIMRNTVKGAWDNFTGSVETASIGLLQRFQPAIKRVLNTLAGKVNTGAGTVGAFLSGVGGARPKARLVRGPGGRVERAAAPAPTGAQAAGLQVRAVATSVLGWVQGMLPRIVAGVRSVATQIISAFAPAAPFLRNVLLPLLIGIGKGVLGGVVGAFKVAIPVIRIVASVLGFVGRAAAPLRGVIQGIGMVIGFLAGGPILKLLGMLPKVGIVFRLLGIPLRIAGGALRGVVKVIGGLARGFGRAFTFVQRFAGTLSGGARRVAVGATNMIGGVIHTVQRLPGRVAALAGRVVSRLAGRLRGAAGAVLKAAGSVGRAIVNGIVNAIKSAPGAIAGGLAWLVDQLPVPGFVKSRIKDALGAHAAGGMVRSPLQLVGEHGPELAAMPIGSRVVPAADTRAVMRAARQPTVMLPGGQVLRAQFVIPIQMDGRQVHRVVETHERRLEEAR
jgi:TP901 family phage tail tape measure protein